MNHERDNVTLGQDCDQVAPDGSEIRLLAAGSRASLVHCTLPAGQVSAAVRHQTVEELWFVLEGDGEIWRDDGAVQRIDELQPGLSFKLDAGHAFQFRASADGDLKILIATIPPWPSADEAVPVDGTWRATV